MLYILVLKKVREKLFIRVLQSNPLKRDYHNIEIHTYNINSNLTKTVDKNDNTQKNTYDYQNWTIVKENGHIFA